MLSTQLNLSSDITKTPLVSFLFSQETQKLFEKEKSMIVLAQLVNNVIIEAEKSFSKGTLKDFDANPGDAGCQLRGLELRTLLSSSFIEEEFKELKQTAQKLKKLLQTRNPKKEAALEFFNRNVISINVSKEMAFLLECRLLQQLKIPNFQDENGIIFTKTEISRLSMFSKGISIIDNRVRNQCVDELKAKVSQESVSFIQKEASKISSFVDEEKEFLEKMLSDEMIVKSDCGSMAERSFSCAFFNMKAVLQRLKEEQVPIAFKSIVKKGEEPFLFFMRSPSCGDEFTIIPDESLDPKEIIVVFEGAVLGLSKEEFSKKVETIGFSKLVLALDSQEAPFTPTSDLSSIKNQKALDEIMMFQKAAEHLGCVKSKRSFLILDHVFANTIEEERLRK